MYDSNNIFAKIIRNELPATKVYEDDKVLAFKDINPVAPVHILVIPKGEYKDFNDFITNADSQLVNYFFSKVKEIAEMLKVSSGYRIVSNIGESVGQSVFHFHVHIIGGKQIIGLIG